MISASLAERGFAHSGGNRPDGDIVGRFAALEERKAGDGGRSDAFRSKFSSPLQILVLAFEILRAAPYGGIDRLLIGGSRRKRQNE